jgi:LPXTG-motif cell wall-anchored protein
LRKVMLLAAVVAMVMAAAVPALAQTVTQIGDNNIACVQTAVQQNAVGNDSPQGNGNAQANQYGDNVVLNNISSVSAQAISQECNITVAQVNTIVNKALTVNKGKVVVAKATASASASASAPAKVQYKAPAAVQYKAPAAVQYQYSAPAAVQYQYASASASASAAPAAALPETGGSSLIALGAGVLLVAGGLLARRIVR